MKKVYRYASLSRMYSVRAKEEASCQLVRDAGWRSIGWAYTDGTFSAVRTGSLSRQLANQLGRPEYYAVNTTKEERLYFVKVTRDFRMKGQ